MEVEKKKFKIKILNIFLIDVTPVTTLEIGLCTLIILLSCAVFANTLSTVGNIFKQMHK